MRRSLDAVVVMLAVWLVGCSGPKPVLYPNSHFQTVGEEAAQHDIADCRKVAKAAGASSRGGKGSAIAGHTAVGAGAGAASGAVGGAIAGSASTGAMIGAATGATGGFLSGL